MAYGTPTDPVGGTVITVAYAVANILDPIRWLRLLQGNADPPGSSYVVVSTSTTGTSWQKIPTDAIANGAIDSTKLAAGTVVGHLGFTPANKAGDTFTGTLSALINASGTAAVSVRNQHVSGISLAIINAAGSGFDLLMDHASATLSIAISGTSAAFSGALSAASATISGAVNTGILTAQINAAGAAAMVAFNQHATGIGLAVKDAAGTGFDVLIDHTTAAFGVIISGTSAVFTSTVQGLRLISTQATGTAPFTVASTTEVTNLNASRVASKIPTATPAANALPLADGSGKLDAWVTAASGVPSGLVAMFRTAAAIPAGWTRESALDGRIPVGAGTTFSKAFTEATDYGSAWSITPAGSVTIVIAANASANGDIKAITPGETSAATVGHGHGITSQTFSGTPFNTWDGIALRAYVYAKKD